MASTCFSDRFEDEAALYLFFNLTRAFIVPKRVFRSTEELDQFRGWSNGASG